MKRHTAQTISLLQTTRRAFHAALLIGPLSLDERGFPSIADAGKKESKGNQKSIKLAQKIVGQIGPAQVRTKQTAQGSGGSFEDAVVAFLRASFPAVGHLRPGAWTIERGGGDIHRFAQLAHLAELADLLNQHPEFRATVQADYLITPDIVIHRSPEDDHSINATQFVVDDKVATHTPLRASNNSLPLLHATISCKWTIRSDRVQNTRTEAQNLIRNRKGRVPHIVAVTAEPLPSRLASIALGNADLDCLYHFALPELISAHKELGYDDDDMLDILVDGRRIRDISDLPLDLAV